MISSFLDKLAALIWEGKSPRVKVNRDFFELYKEAFRNAIEEGWKSAGVDVDWSSPDMLRLAVMEANVFRFACAKSEALLSQLSTLARKSDTFAQFRKAADELGQVYNKRYLETEYNFAHAVGQNGAKYQRHIKEKEIFPFVQYQTVGDHRVRYAHQILDGKIFEVGSDAYDLITPPNGWGCRCELNQLSAEDLDGKKALTPAQIKDLLRSVKASGSTTEWDYMVKHGFNVNRGKLGTVFLEKELYSDLKKVPGEAVVKKATEATIPETFRKNFAKDFEKDPLPAEFWKYVPEGQVYNRVPSRKVSGGGAAFYMPSTKEIVIKKTAQYKESAIVRKSVVVHETAHALHYDLKLITDTGIDARLKSKMKDDFFQVMQKDVDLPTLFAKFGRSKHWNNISDLQALDKFKQFSRTDLSDMMVSVMDTVEAISVRNGRHIGYGHGLSYQSRGNNAYMEIFAHVWENRFVGNPVFEHYFPTLYKETLNLADEIINDLNK